MGTRLGLSLGLGQVSVSIQGQDQEDQGRRCLEPLGSESKSISLLRFSGPSHSPKVIFSLSRNYGPTGAPAKWEWGRVGQGVNGQG